MLGWMISEPGVLSETAREQSHYCHGWRDPLDAGECVSDDWLRWFADATKLARASAVLRRDHWRVRDDLPEPISLETPIAP